MTATLKHTTQGYVLIVDERPLHGEYYYCTITNLINRCDYNPYLVIVPIHKRIIAAENLEGVKGIALNVDDTLITDKALVSGLLKEVSFEEVQATEHEEYWLVRL